jgi:hypothetical protein
VNKFKPTSGATWRKSREEGEVVTLPSGNVARLRPVALDQLIISGKLPDLLTPIAAKSLWTETDTSTIADQVETAKGFAELVNLVVPLAMLTPRIVLDPQADDEIAMDDIEFSDKIAIFQLATGGSTVLRAFRERQEASVDALPDSEDVRPKTEPPVEPYRPVDGVTVR